MVNPELNNNPQYRSFRRAKRFWTGVEIVTSAIAAATAFFPEDFEVHEVPLVLLDAYAFWRRGHFEKQMKNMENGIAVEKSNLFDFISISAKRANNRRLRMQPK